MQEIILKILSGPMFGVDVALPDDNVHLYFCDSEGIEISHTGSVYQHALNTLLIPCAKGANDKIILHLSRLENADLNDVAIEVTAQRIPLDSLQAAAVNEETTGDAGEQDDNTVAEGNNTHPEESDNFALITLPLNQPVTIGHAVIALRHISQAWSKEVTQYAYPLPQQNTPTVERHSPSQPAEEKKPFSWCKTVAAIVPCLAATAAIFVLLMPNQVATLKDALSPVNPAISQVKNDKIYILARTQPEAAWSEIALRKNKLSENNIRVIAEPTEVARMEKLLSEHVIPFFDVKFTAAFTVNLLLSQERSANDRNIEQTIRNLLLKDFPYLVAINIQRVSDSVVIANAAERLKSLGLYSYKNVASNHVTFSISGEIDDFQLDTFRQMANEFYDQYGDRYVKFVVNLNEDPLRNRTYKTGSDSYVVIPGNHWLYSDITTTQQ